MIESEELYDQIERYLEGLLSGKELSDFEKNLSEDAALKGHVEKIRRVQELVFMEGLSGELEIIKKAENQYLRKQRFLNYGKWLGSAVLVIGAVTLIWKMSGSKENSTTSNGNLNSKNNLDSSNIDSRKELEKISGNNIKFIPNSIQNGITVIEKNQTSDSVLTRIPEMKFETDTGKVTEIIKPVLDQPCKEIISATFELTATCENKSEGVIYLKSFAGGKAPFKVSMNNGAFQKREVWNFLSAGSYTMLIEDAFGCKSVLYKLNVEEKSCLDQNQKVHFVFSNANSSEWLFSEALDDFTNGEFNLYNNAGEMVYTSSVVNGYPNAWNGIGSHGHRLSMGLYTYRFVKAGKIILQGTITIVD